LAKIVYISESLLWWSRLLTFNLTMDNDKDKKFNSLFTQYIKEKSKDNFKEISLIDWLDYCNINTCICIEDKNKITNVYKDGNLIINTKKSKNIIANVISKNFKVSFSFSHNIKL